MNARFKEALAELQAAEYEIKGGLQLPYEVKDMPMAGTMWIGTLDAGRESQARQDARFATYAKESQDFKVRQLIREVKAILGR